MKDIEESLGTTLPLLLEDYLEKIPDDGPEARDVYDIIRHSHADKNFATHWKPVRFELIKNKHLEQEYEDKKQDLLIRGRQPQELREGRGFYIENNVASLETITAVGLQTHESDYNPLGYSRVGIYLCKHADICLQHALVKHSGSPVMRMIVFKYIIGRLTRAIPRTATAQEFIEPTQGYDCHMSALPSFATDSLQTQFDRSQVYCYEISKLLQPSRRPRQVLPYAVVTFTENGEHNSAVDAKPTPKEKLQGNPRLQEIIKAINSKSDPAASKMGAGLVQGAAGATGVPGVSPMPPLGGTLGNQGSGLPSASMAAAATGAPITMNGAGKMPPAPNGAMLNGSPLSVKTNMGQDNSMQLKMIVSRINARLGAEEKVIPAASGSPLPTEGLLALTPGGNNTNLISNGSLGSGSPTGSRPGSAESMLSGVNPVPQYPQKTSLPIITPQGLSFPNQQQRFSVLGPENASTLKSCATSLPAYYANMAQNISLQSQGMSLLSQRKDPFALDYGNLTGLTNAVPNGLSAGLPAGLSTGLHTGLPNGMAGFANGLPNHLTVGSPLTPPQLTNPSFSMYPGIPSTVPVQHPSYPPGHTYQTLPASSLAPLATTPVMTYRPMTTSVKRAYPDPSAALAEWDKRPKLY